MDEDDEAARQAQAETEVAAMMDRFGRDVVLRAAMRLWLRGERR